MRVIYETDDFRKYEPVIVKDKSGNNVNMMLCEDRHPESGRWEPFYVVKNITGRTNDDK